MTDPGARRHTGTVRRGALRPPPGRSTHVRPGWIVVVVAFVLVAGALGWLLGGGASGDGASGGGASSSAGATRAAAGGSASPLATHPAFEPTSAPSVQTTLEPTARPTPKPTPRPTAPSTPQPTVEPTSAAEISPFPASLVIDFPVSGEVVGSRRINVIGTAPPGATVTRDIPLWFDDHATADDDGLWMIPVELAQGENRLTIRLGDDAATAQVLLVTYQPAP